MQMVNERHPLKYTPLWKVLPYLTPLERVLPKRVVDWANGRQEKLQAETEGKIIVSDSVRRRTLDLAQAEAITSGLKQLTDA